jgi:hypothetical protein
MGAHATKLPLEAGKLAEKLPSRKWSRVPETGWAVLVRPAVGHCQGARRAVRGAAARLYLSFSNTASTLPFLTALASAAWSFSF